MEAVSPTRDLTYRASAFGFAMLLLISLLSF
jgi:hypothetical protein